MASSVILTSALEFNIGTKENMHIKINAKRIKDEKIILKLLLITRLFYHINQKYKNKFLDAINDDLNMPLAMSTVWELARNDLKSKKISDLLLDFDRVLGLDLKNSEKYLEEQNKVELPDEIADLLEKRKKAREEKNWALSDEIRDCLKERGYIVKDTKEGMTVEKI